MYSVKSAKPSIGSVPNPRPFSACDEADLAERMAMFVKLEQQKDDTPKPPRKYHRKYYITYETAQARRTRDKLIAIIGEGLDTLSIVARSDVSEPATKAQLYQMARNGWLAKTGGPGLGPVWWTVTPEGRALEPELLRKDAREQARKEKAQRRAEMLERRAESILAFCADWVSTKEIAQMFGMNKKTAANFMEGMEGKLESRMRRIGSHVHKEWRAK